MSTSVATRLCRRTTCNLHPISTKPPSSRTRCSPIVDCYRSFTSEHSKGTTMKSFFVTTLTAGALASAALGLAGTVNAAPSGPSSVDQTVSQLRSQGYQVVMNRVGTTSLGQCTISGVRPGQTFSRTDSGAPGADDDIVTTVTNKTVYVDVAC